MQIIFDAARKCNQKLKNKYIYNQCAKNFITALLSVLIVVPVSAGVKQDHQDVIINQAYEIVLPQQAASVLLGNADIADIISQTGDSVVIAGKKIGQTNLLVRDRAQKLLGNILLNVKAAENGSITLYRGTARAEYSCANHCAISSTAIEASPANAAKPLNEDGQVSAK